MSLAAILAVDDPFVGSGPAHAGFSGRLPPLRPPQGLDAPAAAASVVAAAPASSPFPAARVGGFTPINCDDSLAFVTPVPPIMATPPATVRHSPGLFVSPGSPSFAPSSASSLVEVWTDIAAVIPSPHVVVSAPAPALSSPGLSGSVRPSPHVPLPSQGKTQCNALLQVNQILANTVGQTGEARCGGCLWAWKPVCWVGEPNSGRPACALCAHRAQGCNAMSCLHSSFPPFQFGLLID